MNPDNIVVARQVLKDLASASDVAWVTRCTESDPGFLYQPLLASDSIPDTGLRNVVQRRLAQISRDVGGAAARLFDSLADPATRAAHRRRQHALFLNAL